MSKGEEFTSSVDFTTCTTATLRKYIETYDELPSLVPQYLLGACVYYLQFWVKEFYLPL